jgi:hypothetical protein
MPQTIPDLRDDLLTIRGQVRDGNRHVPTEQEPASPQEAENEAILLRASLTDIESRLELGWRMDPTGMRRLTPKEYAEWRSRARRAYGWRRARLEFLEAWLRRNQQRWPLTDDELVAVRALIQAAREIGAPPTPAQLPRAVAALEGALTTIRPLADKLAL